MQAAKHGGRAPTRPEPWLLVITATWWNRWLCLSVEAAMVVVPLWWWWRTRPGDGHPVLVATVALLSYTLYEYLLHRFAFHGRSAPRWILRGHGRHHGAPDVPLSMPFVATVAQAAALWSVAVLSLGSANGSLFTSAFGVGYGVYGAIHSLVHDHSRQGRIVRWLRDVHEVHHEQPGANFGVTFPLWDWVFGTWQAPGREVSGRRSLAHAARRAP